MKEKKNYEVVVGIDFGSSGSGIAYSFMNKSKINYCNIPGADIDKKVPTEIILDDNNKTIQFGSECKQCLQEKGLKIGHYFKNIKINLYKKKDSIKSINSNKDLPLSLVIQRVLEKLKELCLEQLNKLWKNIDEKKIKWVVTVPAIWGNFEKGIMIEACENAGLISKNEDKSLFFALEPEAASIYCSKCGDIKEEFIKKGKYYIICDLGGGTGDIITHLVGSNDSLEEITQSDGGIYGSNEIDRKLFEELIYNIFGYKDFNSLKKKMKELSIKEDETTIFGEWCDLERQIKNFKEGANLEKVKNKINYPICFNVFEDFVNEDMSINDLIEKYNSSCFNEDLKLNVKSKKKWIVELPYKIIDNYILEQSKLICKKIENILSKNNKDINTIIFVGGYCSNEILISYIKERLKKKITNFLYPNKPYLAVMEGSVLFGLNPNLITIRIAKYTIGIAIRKKLDEKNKEKYASGEKIFNKEDNIWWCPNCFNKFIEVNQKLELGQSITKTFNMVGKRICRIKFYQTLKSNPIFVYEKGIEKIAEFTLNTEKDFPLGERNIEIRIKFGGTFIDVKAIHLKSQKILNGTLYLNK